MTFNEYASNSLIKFKELSYTIKKEIGMKGRVNHIELYVKNLAVSTQFWGWLLGELGYETYQQWPMGVSYKLEDGYIVFVQVEDKYLDKTYHRCGPGLNHLAFNGSSREFVDEMTAKLKNRGVRILYEDKHPYAAGQDYYAVFFEDPDRMKVEIVAD